MHSVLKSAMSRREARRRETEHRISLCARLLACDKGLDGFTMDDLANAAGVARRTLFNHFSGKDAAVLGNPPAPDPALVEEFRAGGPHGRLVDDVAALVEALLEAKGLEREDAARVQELLAAEPRLYTSARDRFETLTSDFTALLAEREGSGHDPTRARVLVRVMGALFDLALADWVAQPDRDLVDVFDELLRTAREVFTT